MFVRYLFDTMIHDGCGLIRIIASISIMALSGRAFVPTADRACGPLTGPNTAVIKSLHPFMTKCCWWKLSLLWTRPNSLITWSTSLMEPPSSWRIVAMIFHPACCAAAYPMDTTESSSSESSSGALSRPVYGSNVVVVVVVLLLLVSLPSREKGKCPDKYNKSPDRWHGR